MGAPSARIRDVLWNEVRQYTGEGRALLAYQTNNEQGYTFETHDHAWHPTDHEGLTLIRRPNPGAPRAAQKPSDVPRQGWSKASKRRKYGGR